MKEKTNKMPSPTSAEMLMNHINIAKDIDKLRQLFNLAPGELEMWFSGRRHPPSMAFADGFRWLKDFAPNLDLNAFISTVNAEKKLPVPNPHKTALIENKKQKVDR